MNEWEIKMDKQQKFIETLSQEQKEKLSFLILYESVNLWLFSALFGAKLAVDLATKRGIRKYKWYLKAEQWQN